MFWWNLLYFSLFFRKVKSKFWLMAFRANNNSYYFFFWFLYEIPTFIYFIVSFSLLIYRYVFKLIRNWRCSYHKIAYIVLYFVLLCFALLYRAVLYFALNESQPSNAFDMRGRECTDIHIYIFLWTNHA